MFGNSNPYSFGKNDGGLSILPGFQQSNNMLTGNPMQAFASGDFGGMQTPTLGTPNVGILDQSSPVMAAMGMNADPSQGFNLDGALDFLGGDTFKGILGGVGMLGNFWNAAEQRNMAKKQFNFMKDFANKNLLAQETAYNARLKDTYDSRKAYHGDDYQSLDEYMGDREMNVAKK